MLEHKKCLFITKGSEIAIIGGGPTGSFFAKFACEYARKLGIDIRVTIYSNRRFSEACPKGCKGCVGVINERLNYNLKQHGIILLEDLIMQTIDSLANYCFQPSSRENFPYISRFQILVFL